MLKFATDAITSFSYFPLQMAMYLGFVAAGISILAIPVVIILRASGSQAFFGQATTLIAVLFLGGVQLISLGILGEYIGRLYDEAKGRPFTSLVSCQTQTMIRRLPARILVIILLCLASIISSERCQKSLKSSYAASICSSIWMTSSGQIYKQCMHSIQVAGSDTPRSASKAWVGHSVSQSRHILQLISTRTGLVRPLSVGVSFFQI